MAKARTKAAAKATSKAASKADPKALTKPVLDRHTEQAGVKTLDDKVNDFMKSNGKMEDFMKTLSTNESMVLWKRFEYAREGAPEVAKDSSTVLF